MKRITPFFPFILALLFSCTKDSNDQARSTGNEHMKHISYQGKIIHQYSYNGIDQISEDNSIFFCNRYSYDKNSRLVRIETAADMSALTSSVYVGKNELMTPDNSTITSYRLFEYNSNGKLSKVENYYHKTGHGFEYTSMNSYEYDGDLIIRENLHDQTGQVTQFNIFTYDVNSNVTNEKYYSSVGRSEPELIRETTYQYDNCKNPFRIFRHLGSPGLYTNTNNIVETNSTLYEDVSGIDKNTVSKRAYEYNENGYPVKLITGDSEEEYYY